MTMMDKETRYQRTVLLTVVEAADGDTVATLAPDCGGDLACRQAIGELERIGAVVVDGEHVRPSAVTRHLWDLDVIWNQETPEFDE